ncbi:MAG: hypothetical protein HYY16_13850 [Planctomycetes bacterium]|nr:hypothetical protein [Planctomycetota bacterium]
MASSCTACHTDIGAQVATSTGFHGTIPRDKPADCDPCHHEHMGENFPLVNPRSFSLAGIDNPAAYDHAGLNYALTGKHATAACVACHRLAETKILEKGRKRFLGLSQECTRCHEDTHKGAFGTGCALCHGQEQPFKLVARFKHTSAFPLEGGHAGVSCAACHPAGSDHAVDVLRALSAERNESALLVRSCSMCHRSPHRDSLLIGVAQEVGSAPMETCTQCHDVRHKTFLAPQATLTPQRHAATGFALDVPHDKVACEKCHEDYGRRTPSKDKEAIASTFLRLYPGRKPDQCVTCHADPHRGQFASGTFAAQGCLACHERRRFVPHAFDASMHAKTSFPLEGEHRSLDCGKCHPSPPLANVRLFHSAPTACRACHIDAHKGQFDKGAFRNKDCRACHDFNSFMPSVFTLEMHQAASFPLTGLHRGVSCNECHRPSESAPRGRRIFCGTASRCDACHQNVHDKIFDAPHLPQTVGLEEGCARCHTTESFRVRRFDHALWTGYAVRGAHAKLECAACHKQTARGRTLGRAAGTLCRSCHSDPHVGQFGPSKSLDCARCHKEEGTFHDLIFNHQTDSRFSLDEHHLTLKCGACHLPTPIPGGGTAIRYKPLGILCGDCHAPRGPREGR